jgi:hypothetical protein
MTNGAREHLGGFSVSSLIGRSVVFNEPALTEGEELSVRYFEKNRLSFEKGFQLGVKCILAISLVLSSGSSADSLVPLDNSLRAGVQFDGFALPAVSETSDWFWIPSWFAGHWKMEMEKRIYYLDYVTGEVDRQPQLFKEESEEKWGAQLDSRGGIWEYAATPYRNTADSGDVTFYEYVSLKKPINVSGNEVTILFRATSVAVGKETKRIVRSQQLESVQVYKNIAPGVVECSSSIKEFDQAGKPVSLVKRVGRRKLMAKFVPIEQNDGQKLRPLFIRFLHGKGLDNLIPP